MFTWLAMFLSMAGAYYVGEHKVRGFYIWLVANMIWLTDSILRYDIPQSCLWIFYNYTAYRGIRTWK